MNICLLYSNPYCVYFGHILLNIDTAIDLLVILSNDIVNMI